MVSDSYGPMTKSRYANIVAVVDESNYSASRIGFYVVAVVLVLLPLAGGFLDALLFNSNIYKVFDAQVLVNGHLQNGTISQPDWAPPSWLFAPVWSVLYLMMGVASVLIIRQGVNWHTGVAITIYAVQLLLNWLWTPVFFGAEKFAAVDS
jgi:hypothetical protein